MRDTTTSSAIRPGDAGATDLPRETLLPVCRASDTPDDPHWDQDLRHQPTGEDDEHTGVQEVPADHRQDEADERSAEDEGED